MENYLSQIAENIAQLRLRQSVFLSPQESFLLSHPSLANFYHQPIPNNYNYLLIPLSSEQISVLKCRSQAFIGLNSWMSDIANYMLTLDLSHFPMHSDSYRLFQECISSLLEQESYFLIPETIASFLGEIYPSQVASRTIAHILTTYETISSLSARFSNQFSVFSVKFACPVSIHFLARFHASSYLYDSIEFLEVAFPENDFDKLKLTIVFNGKLGITTVTEALSRISPEITSAFISSAVAIYPGYHDIPLPFKRLSELPMKLHCSSDTSNSVL